MGSEDSFEARLRALADGLSKSIADADLGEVADRLGLDPERVRGLTGAVEGWLNERGGGGEPLFGERAAGRAEDPRGGDAKAGRPQAKRDGAKPSGTGSARAASEGGRAGAAGPHPLDLPNEAQGRALAALDSGRWTLRPGSGHLTGPDPASSHAAGGGDLGGELRARDWITPDGVVTLVGHQALLRWCATARPDADADRGDGPGTGSSTL